MSFGSVTLRNCGFHQVLKTAKDLSVSTLHDSSGRVFFRVGEMRTKEGKVVPIASPIKTKDGGSVLMVQLAPCDPTTITSREQWVSLIERGMIVWIKDGRLQKYPGTFGKVGTLSSYTLKVSPTEGYVMNFPGGSGILTEPAKDETPEYLKKTYAHLFNAVVREERKEDTSTSSTFTPRPPAKAPVARGATTVVPA